MTKENEEFLKSIGQKSTGYIYLKYQPNYFTEGNEDTVKIDDKDVPLNKKLLNYKKLEEALITNSLNDCLKEINANRGNYNSIFFDVNCYLGDLYKLAMKEIPSAVDNVEIFIIKTLNIMSDLSSKLFNQYDADLKQADINYQNSLARNIAKSQQEAANNTFISYTDYTRKNIFGDKTGVVSVAFGSTVDVTADTAIHQSVASELRSDSQRNAKDTLDSKLYEMICDKLTSFTLNFEDIFVKNKPDLFVNIDYRSVDFSTCPYKYKAFLIKDNFKESDFANIKKLLKFYGIEEDFVSDIEYQISQKIYDSIDNNNGEYKGSSIKLYYYLTGKKNLNKDSGIGEEVYSTYYAELKSFALEDAYTSKEDVKEAKELIAKIEKNQSIFNEEQLANLNKLVDKVKKAQKLSIKESRKNDTKRKKRILILSILSIFIIGCTILYFVVDYNTFVGIVGTLIGIAIVLFLHFKIRKAIKKIFRGY